MLHTIKNGKLFKFKVLFDNVARISYFGLLVNPIILFCGGVGNIGLKFHNFKTFKAHYFLHKFCAFFIIMGASINIQGKRFGNLLVIGRNGSNNDKKAVWLCLCDCGRTVNKTYLYLKKAKELYCGNEHPTKVCTQCKIKKDKSEYHKAGKGHINPKCKECISLFYEENKDIISKQYHEKRKDNNYKERMRQKNYRSWLKNKHKELTYKRKYNKRPEVIAHRKKIHLDRKANDIQYNLKRRLRGRVRDCLKSLIGKHYKYKSSLLLLGCDMPFFKSYIESKFQDGMNWGRFSYIHLDHIRPCNTFDLTKPEDQRACFHYSNLQPLWEVDNLTKSKKYAATL